MVRYGDAFAEKLVAGDSDRSPGTSSGDESGVEGADETVSMFWARIMMGEGSSDTI